MTKYQEIVSRIKKEEVEGAKEFCFCVCGNINPDGTLNAATMVQGDMLNMVQGVYWVMDINNPVKGMLADTVFNYVADLEQEEYLEVLKFIRDLRNEKDINVN